MGPEGEATRRCGVPEQGLGRGLAEPSSNFVDENGRMSETRYDFLTDRWVIVAPERLDRPDDFSSLKDQPRKGRFLPQDSFACPFCRGNEKETPPPFLSLGNAAEADPRLWLVRVVPNKFPALRDRDAGHGRELGASTLLVAKAHGSHEVIIECPEHSASVVHLPDEHWELILRAYRMRLETNLRESGYRYAVVFKNYGADAGASLYHAHSQLISLSFVPPSVRLGEERLRGFYRETGQCWTCLNVAEEMAYGERILLESRHFVAFCPFASALPYGIRITSKRHCSRFEDLTNGELSELGWFLKRVVLAMERSHPYTAYNWVLHTSPRMGDVEECCHWRMDLTLRLAKIAGFEWGTDCYINPVVPERAAERFRQHLSTTVESRDLEVER